MSVATKSVESLTFDWNTERELAATRFEKQGFQTKKDEAWKYTSLSLVPTAQMLPVTRQATSMPTRGAWNEDKNFLRHWADAFALFSRPGSKLPTALTVELCNLNEPKDKHKQLFRERFKGGEKFELAGHILQNRGSAQKALVIRLKKNAAIATPLELHHVLTSAASDHSSFPQIWLVLETGSQLTLVERFYGGEEMPHLQNAVVNIVLKEGAKLTHIRSQDLPKGVTHLYNAHIEMQANSQYQAFSVMSGASLSRQEVQVHLLGEGAHCDQQGIIIGKGKQHHDAYLPVYQLAPACYSNQNFRQLLDGESKGIFYGRVEVPQTSPKTEAHQMNKNLLLSDAAQVFTRPELDILTDEVVCSHGATTGALDEQALYYLQARGIAFEDARSLLTQGFMAELIDSVENETVRNALLDEVGKASV